MTIFDKPLPDYSFAVPYEPPAGGVLAFICDIDGTLMRMGDRKFTDYDKVSRDTVNAPVARVVRALRGTGWRSLFVSGRPESCRAATEQSIATAVRGYAEFTGTWDLWMRPDWLNVSQVFDDPEDGARTVRKRRPDYRPDYVVKYEIFNREIRDKYTITCAIDDRLQVVHLWRHMGILTLDVAGGDF